MMDTNIEDIKAMGRKELARADRGLPPRKIKEAQDNNYEEFVTYFDSLDEKGIAWGNSDLIRKAKELNLPIPKQVDGKLIWDDDLCECGHTKKEHFEDTGDKNIVFVCTGLQGYKKGCKCKKFVKQNKGGY